MRSQVIELAHIQVQRLEKQWHKHFLTAARKRRIYLAAQCCEHLNRAIIIEKAAAKEYRLPMVNVVPKLKAGGSFATAVYAALQAPVAVEAIQAHAGMILAIH